MNIYDSPSKYNQITYDCGYNNTDMKTNGEQMITSRFLRQNDIVFDVGANAGTWTEHALSVADVSIHAFEPLSEMAAVFMSNFRGKRVVLTQQALSENPGVRTIYVSGPRHPGQKDATCVSSFFPINLSFHDVTSTAQDIPTTTLDAYCSGAGIEKIDFLKIDSEGAEYEILKGARGLLQKGSIRRIQFEYGPSYQAASTSLKMVLEYLFSFRMEVFRILPNDLLRIRSWEDFLENYVYSNHFASLDPVQ